ncbi:MAG: amino acid adenylation domain-containing protein [Bacteroidales bacterium]|nr:amino acid adenylation domain-containing protein [Bacteroidales bacterium]
MKKVDVSKIQKQFWILNEIYPKSGAYNLFSVFKLNRPLNPEYLQKAVKTVIDRHEPLRTSFKFIDNELFQVIRTPDEIDISITEIIIGESFNEDNIHHTIVNEVNKAFDLAKGPLYRFTLFNFENQISVLSIVFHHIIIDVRSEGIFAKELSEAYNSLAKNEKIKLGAVPFQYSDYIKEINPWYSSDQYLNKLKELARDSPDPNSSIKLPNDYIENGKTDTEGSDAFFMIDKQLADRVRAFSIGNNINPYRFFLTAYAIFLKRLSNQDKIYIGLPLTNRTRPVSKSTFGCFINALPFLVDFSTEKSSRIVLEEVIESLSRLLDRQEIPFTDLVNYNRSEGDATLNPYFQTGFAFKPPMQLEFDNIIAKPLKIEKNQNQTEFDFLLTLYPEDERFVGYVGYSKRLFKRQTIERWISIFKKIVVQLIESPELSVSKISILTDEDNENLRKFNNTEVSIPECLVHNYLENQAGLTPSKTAVIAGGRNLTYRELDNQSNQLANYLLSMGVTPGDIVGLCIERSVDMMVSVLGILKAGCCYLPMDPSFPDDRIKYMYEDSGAKVLISQSSLKKKFSQFPNITIVLTDTDQDKISKSNTVKPELNISFQSLAYIIYTSGSTGKPKGVKVPHKGVVNLIESMSKVPGIKEDDILLAVVTLSFDMSVFELFIPLSRGATVVIASSQDTTDGQALANLIEKYNITMLQATPSLWNILLGSGWKGKNDLRAFCGGEALAKNMVRQILPKVREFWNCYGPTETTVYATCIQITDPDAPIIIGKPLDNTSIHILDKNNNQLPIGVIGEVCIGGLGVTKGYNNKPELTEEKFIPFDDGQIIYKTGDLGRFLADGNIELFGRIDNQIKLRGYRIEPGEIESLLSQVPGVKEAVVRIHKFEDNDERLVAYLNVGTEFKLASEEIKGSLSQHLPGYMIPSFFQTLDGFPRLPNGKINKNALILEIDESFKEKEIDFDSLTETHKKLYNIWENVLKIKNMSPSGSFFDIGGNSLLAIRILNKIKEELGFTMSFKDFIAHPTIIQSGSYIDSQSETADKAIELIHLKENSNLPLSFNQKRLWLISKLQPDIASYIIPYNFKFTGSLNREIFQKSIEMLFQRHCIIFSVVREVNGEPYCDILPSKVDISFFDYSGLSESEKSRKVIDIFNADSRKIFDLENGPLYRLYLIKTRTNEYYFRISIHHIIFDGWSWSVLAKDFNRIYNSLLKGKEVVLEEIEFQQYDYAQWEKSSAGSKHEAESVEFWKKNLEGASPILNFPYDFQRKDEPSGRSRGETIKLSKKLSEKLRSISKSENSSLFTTMLSAFGIQMQEYSGEDDINVGLPVAYRPHSKLENIFGMFVNTVVVRLRSSKRNTFRDIIHNTNEAALNAIAHQDLPFEKVVEIVNPDRSSNANPLFQVAFVWQNNLDEPIQMDGIRSEKITAKERTSIFDITMSLWERDGRIEGELECNLDIFKSDTIISLRNNFIYLLQTLVENPDLPISDINIVSDRNKKLLEKFNQTDVLVPDILVQNFFEIHRNQNPLKTAVISGNKSLNFMELDSQANQLAGHLISLGVTPGDVIGVCMERSIEMIISLFGALKAGACYLPIDSELPDDRIKFMYEDSGAKVLISKNSLHEKFYNFTGTQILLLDKDNEKLAEYSSEKPALNIDSNSLAYIIYTSGSTGKPKGVKVHHHAVVNWIQSMSKALVVTEIDNALAVATPSFDMSLSEIFLALSNGATLIFPNLQEVKDAITLINLIDKYDITLLQATPSLWNILLDNGWKGKDNLKGICGGEALTPKLVRQILPKIKELHNYYGPTETTMCSTGSRITDPDSKIHIGKPIDNTKIYILNEFNYTIPVGVFGEVAIGGMGVSKGYINRPELTAEKFIPFKDGQIIYKTGDLGRFLVDGNIELLGRIDNQIKLRGFRIELGEIESLLSQLTGVKEAVVKVHKFEDNDERLVAFLNVDTEFKLTKEEITRSLSRNLPVYMMPSFFQTSDGFPRLPNGKINRKALILETDVLDRNQEIDFESLSETQKKLFNIWENILKTKNITPSGNFFDIGGNSLLAIRILNKIKEKLGFTMSFKTFIGCPTIIQSGDYIDSQSQTAEKEIELIHLSGTTNLPLSLNQKRLWLISKLQPDIPSYIIPNTYKFSGTLNREIFQKSLDIIFQRHFIVFSVIKESDGEPYCDIIPSEINISYIDYSGLPENEKSEKVNDLINADSRKVFDLQNGPLFRLFLIKTRNDEYYFRISIHHIVFDGWSWSVFVKDLNQIYNSLLNGKEVALGELEFQQYDYAQWEKDSVGSKHEVESVEFWKENLNGASSILNFPYDFQRTEEPSGRGGLEAFFIPEELSDKLRNISKKENSSLFATLFSVFGIQMQKYSGEDDINIGLPVAYRPHSKLENIFGMFVNTVVVRLKNETGSTFKDTIHRTSEAALNAIAHRELPFDKIVEIVNPERNSNVNPLFQVAFAWQDNLDEPIKMDGIISEKIPVTNRTSTFDITLSLWENGKRIEGEIEYNLDILKKETILHLRDSFIYLLQSLIENPESSIESLSIISENEKKIIDGFNDTSTNYPKDKTIAELFEELANLYPNKTAIVFKENSLTYSQLNEKSNQLARVLRNSGVIANDPVCILVDRSIDMIVGIFGILKAGGAYVPLDPEYPEFRKNFIISDSGCKILVTQNKYITDTAEGIIKLSLDSPDTYHTDKSNLEGINVPSDLAYIIYTSGTTGVPKGTLIPQRGVVRLVRNTNYVDFTSEDRVLQSTSIVFDASTVGIFGALLNGATLYLIDKETVLDPNLLGYALAKDNITMTDFPTALFTQIAEVRSDIFNKLKTLLIGGDSLSAPHINKVRKNNPQLAVINEYGPTENSCNSTAYKVDRDFDYNIPIGKPISNSTAYIFDKNMNYQPIGIIGELYVGGDGLSRGYLNRDDLNRKSFIDHPYFPGKRLYKTGDLARWLPDGNIEFHGRIDNQIKIRGFRVELGEIEFVLSEIEGVVETVIKPIKIGDGDYKLIAFLNVVETFGMDSKDINNLVKEKLPSYMLPSAYKLMHGFPLTINGKIDRKALVFDLSELENKDRKETGDLTQTEKVLIDIWGDVLKTKDIISTDNFFDIGGNSLMVLRLVNKIKEKLGVTMSLKAFMNHPTIIQSANYIDSQTQTKEKDIELVHATEMTNLPLTFNQKRLWLISKLRPDIPSYIVPFTFKLTGPLNCEIFKKSIDILFRRHHIVFSVIKEDNGEPYCDIVPSKVDISFIDYSGLTEVERSEKVFDLINADSRKVFDLQKGPLYRLYLIKTGNEEYYFRMSIHHIVFDGWSWSVLAKDLNNIYNSLLKGKEADLEELEFQQYDYARWEKSSVGSRHEAESVEFWKENLDGASTILNFPYDFKRTKEPSGKGKYETFQISQDLSEKLRKISKAEDSSLFVTMLSAFGIQMQKYSGEDDINIGLPVAYRPHSRFENIIGMFVNTVVVRLRYENELTFRDIIHMTKEAALNAIAHQDLPFEKVVEIVNPGRSSHTNPLFQVGFTWQNNLDEPLNLDRIKSEKVTGNERSAIFDITMALWENENRVEGEIEFNVDILRSDTIVRLRDNFVQLLHSVIENPDQAISEIALISESDMNKLSEFNNTDASYEHNLFIHRKFELQVKENPDLPALLGNNQTISYKELNDHANRLANYLITRGVQIEDKVGICIDRSMEMMISIFGVLKAGAAYLPLSPENPTERLKSIILDANPKLILSSKIASTNIPEGTPVVFIDDIISEPLSENSSNPDVKMTSKNLAYVLYTSGSTGTPKGVMIEHHSVLNRLGWMQKAFPIDRNDTLLQKTPITFDVSVWELFWWFFNGAKLVMLPKGGEKDPEALVQYIDNYNVTTIHFVPSMFATFYETIITRKLLDKLGSLNRIFLSGEALPLKLVKEFNEMRKFYSLPDLINLYGPTEATVDVSYYNCPRNGIENVYIGKPIDNTKLFVVNRKNILQPIGVPGELLIAGVNLARGYLNRPDLTSEKFFDFKISNNQSIRAYHTGDLVKLTPEGEIDYLGRIDNQVKIRGFRIELGDIEAKILEHPMVTHCAVIVTEKGEHKYLVAYVCLKPGNEIDADKLRNYLSGKLPDYMVPPYILFLETLPLTSSGKLNRKSLPAPDRVIEKDALITPSNKNEKLLLDIWSNLLKTENISITDNFFDIGGNSLLAINLANLISREFSITLKALMIFEFPSIKAQSEYLSGTTGDKFSLKNIEIDEKTKNKKNVSFKRVR